jgi:histidinol-phosphate aminotransferase
MIRSMQVEEEEMKFSRREFSRTVGQAMAAVWAAPGLLKAATAATATAKAGPSPTSAGRAAGFGMTASKPIRISANENPYGPSPKAKAALDVCDGVAARYPDGAHVGMEEELAKYHGVKRENILLGCGSGEILRVADVAFVGPGQNAVAAEPTFESVLEYVGVMRAQAVKVPLTADHRHDLPRMAAACTSKTGLVYVCNPNNPTATIVTKAELADFVPRVPATTTILVDEAYYHFVEEPKYGSVMDMIGEHPNVIVARTFSKVYGMAGMRLGYAVGAAPAIARMRERTLYSNANAGVLAAAMASLNDAEYVSKCRGQINGTKAWLTAELKKDGHEVVESHTNFFMVNMGTDVKPVIAAFREKGIEVGRKFPSMGNYLRVTVGTRDEMEAFLSAFREIAPAAGAKAA